MHQLHCKIQDFLRWRPSTAIALINYFLRLACRFAYEHGMNTYIHDGDFLPDIWSSRVTETRIKAIKQTLEGKELIRNERYFGDVPQFWITDVVLVAYITNHSCPN
jgi:hypothetical protein